MTEPEHESFPIPTESTVGQLYLSDARVLYIGDYIPELGYCWVQFQPPT